MFGYGFFFIEGKVWVVGNRIFRMNIYRLEVLCKLEKVLNVWFWFGIFVVCFLFLVFWCEEYFLVYGLDLMFSVLYIVWILVF